MQEAVTNETPPADAFLRDVYNVIVGESDHEIIHYALELYHTPRFRDTLMAFFLSGATMLQVMQGTGVAADTLMVFEKLFINLDVFRNKMEWRAFAEHYVAKCCADEDGETQVKKAIIDGPITLLVHWRIGEEPVFLSDKEILTQQALLAHTKSMAAWNARLTDAESKEAYRWGQFAVSTAQRRNNINDNSDVETDAIVAIQKRKATLEANEAGLALSDILH